MNDLLDSIGVYIIVNRVSDTVYIGSTRNNFKQRFAEHRSWLRCGTHRNKHLQNAYNKYGADALDTAVLEECEHISDVEAAEQRWIDHFRAAGVKMYNNRPRAENNRQWKHPPELFEKISTIRKAQWTPEARRRLSETMKRIKPGSTYTYKGRQGLVFAFTSPDGAPHDNIINLKAFCNVRGLDFSAMAKVHRGERPSHKGWTKSGPVPRKRRSDLGSKRTR